ncbi:hypothetical protein PoB_004983500 [Plakobranchus ocellatus]|uniref:Uncharacterized protein n=1 Tax=Plakobranchus ocellatus TaxID=259542 RepID=A0AAV4BVH5_9GAST|nr:hypothetical protein PoB_004983500 [Plakobranchus ocellatus]
MTSCFLRSRDRVKTTTNLTVQSYDPAHIKIKRMLFFSLESVGGTVASESALKSVGILLLRVGAPPSAFRPDVGP